MRAGRAAWIGLNIISYLCTLAFLGLAITAQILPNWAYYSVGIRVSVTSVSLQTQNELSRFRGLWKQCIQSNPPTTCFALEPFSGGSSYNSVVQPILSFRIAIVVLQLIAILFVSITIITTCAFLILIWKKPERFKPRSGQYTALGGGAVLWLMAFVYFISLLIYYETLSQENYLLDVNLLTARSAWSSSVRSSTVYQPGSMISFAWSALVLLYLGASFQLGASALQQPPEIEQ